MKTLPVALTLLVALGATACGSSPDVVLPDGGRPRQVCTETSSSLPVKVVDAAGAPVESATVTATNLGTGQVVTTVTGSDGLSTQLDATVGPGSVRVSAVGGGRPSEAKQVEWICDECGCTVHPGQLTLTIH